MRSVKYGRNLIATLKATAGLPGPGLVIPVGPPLIAFLRPVAVNMELLNVHDVRVLAEWRNNYVQSFLTEFHATESQTARWLVDVVGPREDKILFMVDDLNGCTFGYMGLDYISWDKDYGEADAVVRGLEVAPGTMKPSLLTLLAWAQGQLGLRSLGVRVRSDNAALKFYLKLGFREIKRVPLHRIKDVGMARWVEDESFRNAKVYLVHMRWLEPDSGY